LRVEGSIISYLFAGVRPGLENQAKPVSDIWFCQAGNVPDLELFVHIAAGFWPSAKTV